MKRTGYFTGDMLGVVWRSDSGKWRIDVLARSADRVFVVRETEVGYDSYPSKWPAYVERARRIVEEGC